MMNAKPHVRLLIAVTTAVLTAFSGSASLAAPLALTDVPLFLNGQVAPLNMLVMGRDHKLFYEAYNDHSDLDGDGDLDVGYRPAEIDYYGYFDSHKCYTYASNRFQPASVTVDKTCSGNWSGDWLNYTTTTRIDALRKVLYGGSRTTDTNTLTVIERSHVPQDAHSWGKEYTSTAVDGYDISRYTPLGQPAAGRRHLFANTTLMLTTDWTTNDNSATTGPFLRVLQSQPHRIWHWVSKESPVAGATIDPGTGRVDISGSVMNAPGYRVRVEVCRSTMPESNCKRYPSGNYKPTGLLQDFGENDTMLFGLLTGSYAKSKSGGVVRKDIGSIRNEINTNSDGTLTATVGIIRTMDRIRVAGYTNYTSDAGGQGVNYPPGLVTTRPINEGEFGGNWGNPVGEMMYEALRYFAGKSGPTPAFDYSSGLDSTAPLSLPKVNSWTNPYGASRPSCAKPFETVMSDVNVSYDTDQLPGSSFAGFTGDLTGLNVSTIADKIWATEVGATSRHFIGQSGATYDGAPTPKDVSSFATIRGLAPEEPTKEGGYYAASVAHFGLTNDINPGKSRDQKVQTFAVAMASPLPRIEIPVGGRTITLVPFAKSVGGCAGVVGTAGLFQPTNQIVDFYVESITPTSGTFQVNFEDVEAGNDHDMDAIVRYSYVVNADSSVTVTLSSDYAAGCIIQHMGYVISGTTADGIYLEVRDVDTPAANDINYFLDTPPGELPASLGGNALLAGAQPLVATRTFTPGSTTGATVLKDPLWYAAKWGGFKDINGGNIPDLQSEWDANNDGTPDNYFLVTNALTLSNQLSQAFTEILARVASASSASVNSGTISSDTRVYQARFNSGDWTGELLAYPVQPDGTLGSVDWNAAGRLPSHNSRSIVTVNTDGTPVPFRWTSLDATRRAQLQPASDGLGDERVDFTRGSDALERTSGGPFRNRPSKLGDIISSAPNFVGKPPFNYSDLLESSPYSSFRNTHASRRHMVYVGGNDGMLHGFDASDGTERVAFIPSPVFRNLHNLSSPSYVHQYFVDGSPNVGDVFYADSWHTALVGGLNKGGQGIYALDITDPETFAEGNANSLHMWEYTDTNDADLGFTFSRPQIVRMHNGRWAAVFGNGYNNTLADGRASTTGNAALYIVDIETGALVRKIDTGKGMSADPLAQSRPNGLATPAPVDVNGDSKIDFIYAGDLFGNVWKFDVRSSNPASWASAYTLSGAPRPFYVARDASNRAQPITSRPVVGRGPNGAGMMVMFGTGKYLEVTDKDPALLTTQTFYGIIDVNGLTSADIVSGRGSLVAQTVIAEDNFDFGTQVVPLRVVSQNPLGASRGWYFDLLSGPPGVPPPPGFHGEMQVSDPILRNDRIIFTTLIPNADPCDFGGSSWLMELDAFSGGRLQYTPFDNDDDGQFGDGDYVTVIIGGVEYVLPAGGKKLDNGIAQRPGILLGESTGPGTPPEYKYQPGTSGEIDVTRENAGPNAHGRQSWRQVR